jgi:uncharacterized membrane protein YheB (UPF0754 family)
MNKSLGTTLVSLLVFGISFVIPHPLLKLFCYEAGLFAVSGAVTNWIAVHMLFERIPFLYGSGVIPARFDEFKQGIRDLVMKTFFTKENIDRFFQEKAFDEVHPIPLTAIIDQVDMDSLFDGFVKVVLQSKLGGMLGMFGGANALEPLRESFKNVVREKLKEYAENPENMEKLKQKIRENLKDSVSDYLVPHISNLVEFRLQELTPEMVKRILSDMIRKHLGWLVVWGGVFGGLIGVASALMKQFQWI